MGSLSSVRFLWPPPWRQTGSNRGSDPCSGLVWLWHRPIFCVKYHWILDVSPIEAITDPKQGLADNAPGLFRDQGQRRQIVPAALWVNGLKGSAGSGARPDADKQGSGEKVLGSSASNG